MNKTLQHVEDFNNVALQFIDQLTLICPNSIITNNTDLFKEIINKKKTTVIDQFALNLYDYKSQIDKCDEDFFLTNDFSDKTNNDKTLIGLMLELKGIWKKLNTLNKQKIFEYLQVLCYYTQEYILCIT